MLPYLNLAMLEIVNLKSDAYTTTEITALAAGTSQTIPAGYFRLLGVLNNMGPGGLTPGNAVRFLNKAILDSQYPGWMTSPPSDQVTYIVRDPFDPTAFYVYPPNSGLGHLQIVYSVPPPVITSILGTFPLDDSYIPACIDYIVYRCLAEQTTIQGALQKAQAYLQKFYYDLKSKGARDAASDTAAQQGDGAAAQAPVAPEG